MIRAHSAQGCYQYWTLHQLYDWLATLFFFLNAATGRRDSPQRERLKLRHASFFNIVLKRNWLHLDRHGDKSRRHLAEAGFIADGGESPSLQSIIFLPTIESSIIAQWWSYCAAGADRLGEWIMAVQRVEGVVKHFSFLFFFWGGVVKLNEDRWCKYTIEG